MSLNTLSEQDFRQRFWNPNAATDAHPGVAEGYRNARKLQYEPGALASTLYFTDVTLRDGQQQRTDEVTTEQRVEVFDSLVTTGVDRIEIGHLGNSNGDQQLAAEIVSHVAEKEADDERYGRVKLQVLFGSQQELIQEGVNVLQKSFQENYGENWQEAMADKVVVHVYDRLDENLRNTSSNPYTGMQSAERISRAAVAAIDAGFTQFSISGEAATATTPDEAIMFYRSITDYLVDGGAENVNVNLANTYGYSSNSDWNIATLAVFNTAVKHGFDDKVTTSIHMHNDVNNALEFTMAAITAGFDRVEGTHTGMGERSGNVANVDVMARLLEQSRHAIETEKNRSRIASKIATATLRRTVMIDPGVIEGVHNWHQVGEDISHIFGPHADYRWRRTMLGNPYIFDNGSGPHDQVMAAAIVDPVEFAPYKRYEWGITTLSMMGRKAADLLAIGDPQAIDRVTVGNHASGGKTRQIKEGTIKRAEPERIEQARTNFIDHKAEIAKAATKGTVILAA
jgi:isopropylmalate/homocitrate/citramalate synthase